MKPIAIIPARGGSKRIPGKNIKLFNGKPIITYSIEAALQSGLFDAIIVSTDSIQIAEIASQAGATVRHRPDHLSDDHTGTQVVMAHVLADFLSHRDQPVEFACCIYPTAPFITPEDLFRGWEAIRLLKPDFAFSVTTYEFPLERALDLTEGGRILARYPHHRDTRSQDLPTAYHDAGHWYWGRTHAFLENRVLYSDASIGIHIPRSRVQDIDTMEDWERAELMHQALQTRKVQP